MGRDNGAVCCTDGDTGGNGGVLESGLDTGGDKPVRVCPDCLTDNLDSAEYCKKCGAKLTSIGFSTKARPVNPSTPQISSIYDAPATRKDIHTLSQQLEAHRSGLAGALSVILPGLGQIYTGAMSGIVLTLGWLIGVPLYIQWCISTINTPTLYGWQPTSGLTSSQVLVGIALIAIWIINVIHASSR